MYESILYIIAFIEITNDMSNFIDIAFALLIITVSVAVKFKMRFFFKSKMTLIKKITMIIITITYQICRCLSVFKSKIDYKSFLYVSVKKYRQKDIDCDERRCSLKKLRLAAMTMSSAQSILITTLIVISTDTISNNYMKNYRDLSDSVNIMIISLQITSTSIVYTTCQSQVAQLI